jgi:hypothetical protein
MPRFVRSSALVCAFVAGIALAQPQPYVHWPMPRIGAVFPAGAKIGTTLDVTITGTDLDEATGLIFSHAGLSGELIVEPEPKPDPKAKAPPKKKGPTNTTVKAKIRVKDDVPQGSYDVRVSTKRGISNPRLFTVGGLPEVNETEPNNDVPEAQKIAIGTTVNGMFSTPTDVDYFAFTAKAGQRIFAHCAAGSIESRAKPLVELFSAEGRRLAQNRNDRGSDALLDATIPADGVYHLRLCEFAYQFGGPENFYRLTLSGGVWVDTVFPPVVEPGKSSPVSLVGRGFQKGYGNIEVTPTVGVGELRGPVKFDLPQSLQDGFVVRPPGSPVNVPVFLAREPVMIESVPPNDSPETAQAIPVPCELCGRIDVKNDLDWFRFTAKKGEPLILDLAAERLGSDMDAYLTILDAKTKREIASENQLDDDPDALHPVGFFTRSTDPSPYRFTPPADGEYLVRVASRESIVTYGPRAIYRLRISPPRPDFRVVVMPRHREQPSGVIARPSTDTAIDVYVHRIDGYNGPVTVTAHGLPDNVTAEPSLVGSNQKWGTLVLKTKPGRFQFAGLHGFLLKFQRADADVDGTFTIDATASIGGKPISRQARTATITWSVPQGSNNPTASRLDQTLPIAVRSFYPAPSFAIEAQVNRAMFKARDGKDIPMMPPFVLKPGDKITVPIATSFGGKDRPPVALSVEPTHPDNQRIPLSGNNANVQATMPKEKTEQPMIFEIRPNAAPGRYRFMVRGDMTVNARGTNATLSAWTPIDVRVVPTSLARLSAANINVKAGSFNDLTVRVERQFDFAGEFAVSVALPDGRGVTAGKAIIPAGKDEIKIPLTAARGAKPGQIQNVIITAVAQYEGNVAVSHEVKVNVNVTK